MKADLRISIQDYRRNRNLKILRFRLLFPSRGLLVRMNGRAWPRQGGPASVTRRLAALRKSIVKASVAGPGAGAASCAPGRPRDRQAPGAKVRETRSNHESSRAASGRGDKRFVGDGWPRPGPALIREHKVPVGAALAKISMQIGCPKSQRTRLLLSAAWVKSTSFVSTVEL